MKKNKIAFLLVIISFIAIFFTNKIANAASGCAGKSYGDSCNVTADDQWCKDNMSNGDSGICKHGPGGVYNDPLCCGKPDAYTACINQSQYCPCDSNGNVCNREATANSLLVCSPSMTNATGNFDSSTCAGANAGGKTGAQTGGAAAGTAGGTGGGGIVPCGVTDNVADACTLCHFITGFFNLVTFLVKLVTIVAFVGIFLAGGLYIISSGNESAITKAKSFLFASFTGFAIILGAWLIIDVTLWAISANQSTNNYLGIGKVSWNKFECVSQSSAGGGVMAPVSPTPTIPANNGAANPNNCGNNGEGYCSQGIGCPANTKTLGQSLLPNDPTKNCNNGNSGNCCIPDLNSAGLPCSGATSMSSGNYGGSTSGKCAVLSNGKCPGGSAPLGSLGNVADCSSANNLGCCVSGGNLQWKGTFSNSELTNPNNTNPCGKFGANWVTMQDSQCSQPKPAPINHPAVNGVPMWTEYFKCCSYVP